MGRTNPTYRDRLDDLERDWKQYRRGLRASEQERFDELFEHAREYAHAAGYLNHPNPEIPLLLSVLLAHQRELAKLDSRLNERDGTDQASDTPKDREHGIQD